MCDFFDGVNSNKSSIIASQYFLLCKHPKIAFIYDCQIEGEIFSPIGILWYKYDELPKYGNIFCNISLNFPIVLVSEMHLLNLILIAPHTHNYITLRLYLLVRDMPDSFWHILTFKCLKSVTALLFCVTFLLISMVRLE